MRDLLTSHEIHNTKCHENIKEQMQTYLYRKDRYATDFAAILIFSEVHMELEKITELLRKTDKAATLSEHIILVLFDATDNISAIRATENLVHKLQQTSFYNHPFFISLASSENFDKNIQNMINKLLARLEYAVEHNITHDVVYEDYVV